MKKLFMAVIALMMTISASAQFYIYCSDGNVIKVDSISMIAPGESEQPDPSAGIGVFSVSADKQVTFSKGNLQYHPANDEWRFAESQWDYVGEGNKNIVPDYNGWIDLFYWGTGDNPTKSSISNKDYQTFVDWGINKIYDDLPDTWRTLTKEEWLYLFKKRSNASSLYGIAQVNGVNGIVILPDNWTCPTDINFKSGTHTEDISDFSIYQSFTKAQWSKFENLGAVFLPCCGTIFGSVAVLFGYYGGYWSSTKCDDENRAYSLYFKSNSISPQFEQLRWDGLAVRLVKYMSVNTLNPSE